MFIHPSEKKQSVNGKITQLKSMCKETKLKLLKIDFTLFDQELMSRLPLQQQEDLNLKY